jgi:cAMP-dependent protein kinase regulator
LDLAITAALTGDRDGALRHAGAILEEDPARQVAVLLLGRMLGELGKLDLAKRALYAAVKLALLEGSLPRAMAAVIELRHLKSEPAGIIDKIAALFARGSKRLLAQGARPPALPKQRLSGVPLPHQLSGDALFAHLETLIESSEEHALELSPDQKLPYQALLSLLDEPGLTQTLRVLDLVWVDAQTAVVEQGRPGQEAYVVARGELDVVRTTEDGEKVTLAHLGSGALFGEMALLSRAPRAASVIAARPSVLLVARSEALASVVEVAPDVGAVLADFCRRRMVDNLIRTSRILSAVAPTERVELVNRFVTRSYEPGQRLITQGKDADGLHLIASGEVRVVHQEGREQIVVTKLSVGEVAGEISLVLRRPAGAHVVATVPTVSLHLPQADFLGVAKRFPGLLSQLYELAVERDDQTRSIVAQEALEADELILL